MKSNTRFQIREMTIKDHDQIAEMFRATPGITFRDADSKEAIQTYLDRNPGLSFVAEVNGRIIGCVMCGHDGRRGYLQHLVVREEFRKRGIGEKLFKKCLDGLENIGIYKTHLFVQRTNGPGNRFWSGKGWQLREDVHMYSLNRSSNENI